MVAYRRSELDFYSPLHSTDVELYVTSMFDWYRLPLNRNDTVLVVSTSSSAATLWVIAYTVLITMIFMAACELATLMVLTFFRVGSSGTRHAMLVAYYNAGSPSRILPIMLGYIYNGLFRCRKGERWAVDRTAVAASCLLFTVAFALISGDMLTKFFLGGRALIRGNVAQVNPGIVFYPDFGVQPDDKNPNAMFDVYKGLRAPAVYQAITRKTSTGDSRLRKIDDAPIAFEEEIIDRTDKNTTQRIFSYRYELTGYELGLRDAPGLLLAMEGRCETYHGLHAILASDAFEVNTKRNQTESVEIYPFWGRISSETNELKKFGHIVALERENYTAPWVFFHLPTQLPTLNESVEYGGWKFQLAPHTAYRLSRTQNPRSNSNDPLDPWYETEPNPFWDESKDALDSYNAPYRVKKSRPPIRCIQNDTYTYNGKSVHTVFKLQQLEPHGLKLSPFIRFVFEKEFGIPVFAAILGYVPFGSLASAVHYVPNDRRLDAERASISTDFLALVETAYVYSREVVRNTALLFPSSKESPQLNPHTLVKNIAHTDTNYRNNADFLIDSHQVAALSVVTLIATPVLCSFLWIVVLSWMCIFNSQTKLDNNSASGRHGLRRSALQATHLYLFLDEKLSDERKWSGRQSNAPYIRNLDDALPDERQSMLENPTSGKTQINVQTTSIPMSATDHPVEEVLSEFSKPKLVEVSGYAQSNDTRKRGNGGWRWVKQNIFGIRGSSSVKYEVAMTRVWNPQIPPVKRDDIREDV